jgi:Dolichyl-phosphate-mannose-protein mannosyltransferase
VLSKAFALELMESRLVIIIVSVLTIILCAFANFPWQLENYDQAKQAFSSWQIVKASSGKRAPLGPLFYQETPGGKVATKPPLVGWVSALFYGLTRSWEAAWRLPSLVAASMVAWLLWKRAAALFGNLAAVIALASFSFNLLTPRLATLVRTDMPLVLITFLIALLFFEQIRTRTGWQASQRALLFFLLTASMLIKGPIVYAFVLPAMALFAVRYRGNAIARGVATGWWPWILSLVIFVAWVMGGVRTMPGFYHKVVVREFAGRFSETFHRPQPFFFYALHLLPAWAPWSLLLIGLLVAQFRGSGARLSPGTAGATTNADTPEKARERKVSARGMEPFGISVLIRVAGRWRHWLEQTPPETFWLLAWGVGGLFVMSCIPSKRVDRIFPVVPPGCLLLGALVGIWHRSTTPDSFTRKCLMRWCAGALITAMVFTASYTVFKIVTAIRGHRDALVKCGHDFRQQAAENHWRYAALKSSNEALVFYLDAPGFTSESEAVRRWKAGDLDSIIGSERRMKLLLPDLAQGETRPFCQTMKGQKRYTILQRRN